MSTTFYLLKEPFTRFNVLELSNAYLVQIFKKEERVGSIYLDKDDTLERRLIDFFASDKIAAIRYGKTLDIKNDFEYCISEYGELVHRNDLLLRKC